MSSDVAGATSTPGAFRQSVKNDVHTTFIAPVVVGLASDATSMPLPAFVSEPMIAPTKLDVGKAVPAKE